MSDAETFEILLLAVRQLRSQAKFLTELAVTVNAVREVLASSDQALEQRIQKIESEAKSLIAQTSDRTLQKLDGIIQQLEGRRPPRVN